MEPNQYQYMYEVEDRHWWYLGNHEIFLQLLTRYHAIKNDINLLDAGCGTGGWLELLKKKYPINETGIDYNQYALSYAKTRGKFKLQQADLNTFNAPENYDLITSFDVICGRYVDDKMAIKNFHTSLKKDAYLLLTVPAYQSLRSKHDEVVHQNKRYKKQQIKTLLENNGFSIIKISYCVCLLFPFALLKRIVSKLISNKKVEHNEVIMPNKFVNAIFLAVMRFEKFLLRYFSLPFGLSVLVLAKKTQ